MQRLKAVIEFDGTDFSGWQVQKNRRTVQGVFEDTLAQRFGQKIKVIGAGRTDTGVHATGQAAHFDCPVNENADNVTRSLNSMLPGDVSLRFLEKVSRDFHARFDAVGRSYRYDICLVRSALRRRYCWEYPGALNAARMRTALTDLLGTHNFKPFAKLNTKKNNYSCTIFETALHKRNESITVGIRADRFLHGMVRAIVGLLVDVGRGAKDVTVFGTVLSTGDRSLVSGLAPANGLFLEHVHYYNV
ncbi:unnamed protein product [marine sediment metagenome]|uniref:Pseudouridine synthase I TruA alpha/beta domain-containing protein n=1 Tax=marine sediment metagenome TaxID=412755 RepID=X0TAT4_9ZZZZ